MSINPNNSLTNYKFRKKLSDCGLKKVNLKQLKPKEVIEDTSMTKKLIPKNLDLNLFMQESLLKNKKMTLRDKLNHFKNYIQSIKSSQIQVPVSILAEKDSANFWKLSSQEQLQKLWLPIKTDCVDLDLNSLKTYANISQQLSQLSTITMINPAHKNWQRTCCLSLQFSQQDFMEKENTIQTTTKLEEKEEGNYITRKIRIYPNQQQKILFNKCLNVSRYFYNKANEYVKKLNENSNKKEETSVKKSVKKSAKKSVKKSVNKIKKENSFILPSAIKLREKILISDSKLSDKDKWQKEVPYDTRELSIRRLYKSYKTSLLLMKNGFINKFDIKYKKKKDNKKSFEINKNAIKINEKGEFRIFSTRLKEKIRVRKRDRKKIKDLKINKPYTNTIIKKEYNRWYICLNIPKDKIIGKKDKPIYSSVFLDPGVRKFQTFYSPDGICGKLGERFSKKEITPLIKEYESYQKILGKNKIKGLKRRCGELITKVQNKVSDLHNQISNFLSTTFESIFIPKFETKKMTNKKTRNISKYTVKSMLKLSHYKFREKLKNMCKIRGNNIKIITEEFTSKTCTGCGKINKDIGSKEIFKCQKCEIEIDRDINASRNICIKNIKENGATPQK